MPMSGLGDASALLAAREAAAGMPEVARAAALVAHAGAGSVEQVLNLPLAVTASLAIAAHVEAFGPQADGICACEECGESIGVLLDLRQFAEAGVTADAGVGQETVTIGGGARALAVHALTTRDLLAAGGSPDPVMSLRRAFVRDEAGRALSASEIVALGADDVAALDAAAERLAGVASIALRMRCPGCSEDITASVDPGMLLWERVDAAAPLLLAEVAALARAFGWSEEAVLGLSASRRRAYLALADEPSRETVS
jgi:hypothetical protein